MATRCLKEPLTETQLPCFAVSCSENMDAVIEFFRWAAAQPGETWFLTYQQYKQWWEAGQPSVEQVTLRYPCDDT